VKCEKCGFEAPIQQWKIVEESKLVKVPEEAIKNYEKFLDDREEFPASMKPLVKFIFRFLGASGLMPLHKTNFVCPKCGAMLGRE